MSMELRWIERRHAFRDQFTGETVEGFPVRVLQYRQQVQTYIPGPTVFAHGRYEWTDWLDVPTVREETP